jgi:hypothetical protein
MWKGLTIFLTGFVLTTTQAQMTQLKFNKHFIVNSTWSTPQWTNNAQR